MEKSFRTSYEKDINSPKAELFLKVRDFIKICIGNSVKEVFNEHITSYKTKYGMYCYIKVKNDSYVHIGWGRGAKIDDRYDVLIGKGSIVRGQEITKLDKKTRDIIKEYIDQTTIILIEHTELKKLKSAVYKK